MIELLPKKPIKDEQSALRIITILMFLNTSLLLFINLVLHK